MDICFICAGPIFQAAADPDKPRWMHDSSADTFNTPHDAMPALYLPEEQVYVLATGVARVPAEDLR